MGRATSDAACTGDGKARPARREQDGGSEKHKPQDSTPRASTPPESRQHHPAQPELHREEGPWLSGWDPLVLHLPRLPVPTWLTRQEPALLGGFQVPQQHLFNHSALATQPLAMPRVCSEPGLTRRAQCWRHGTCSQPTRCSRPHSLTSILGMGHKGANSQRANKSS